MLTSDMMYKIADRLSVQGGEGYGNRFLCVAADSLKIRPEVEALLLEGGMPDLCGTFIAEEKDEAYMHWYFANCQYIRFMYAEFLALMLADEESRDGP